MGARNSKVGVAVDAASNNRRNETKDNNTERTVPIYTNARADSDKSRTMTKEKSDQMDNKILIKRKKSEPNVLPSMKSQSQLLPPGYIIKKETSSPRICHGEHMIPKKLPSLDPEDSAETDGLFHNRQYWFMQNTEFRRKTSFDSVELGALIAKDLAGSYHEHKVHENAERARIKDRAAGSGISPAGLLISIPQYHHPVAPLNAGTTPSSVTSAGPRTKSRENKQVQ